MGHPMPSFAIRHTSHTKGETCPCRSSAVSTTGEGDLSAANDRVQDDAITGRYGEKLLHIFLHVDTDQRLGSGRPPGVLFQRMGNSESSASSCPEKVTLE